MSLPAGKVQILFSAGNLPQAWITTCLNETYSHVYLRRYHLPTANQLKVAYLSVGVGTILSLQIHCKEVTGVLEVIAKLPFYLAVH